MRTITATIASNMGTALTVGEDDFLARLAQLLGAQVQLTTHGILRLAHVLVQQFGVQNLAVLVRERVILLLGRGQRSLVAQLARGRRGLGAQQLARQQLLAEPDSGPMRGHGSMFRCEGLQ